MSVSNRGKNAKIFGQKVLSGISQNLFSLYRIFIASASARQTRREIQMITDGDRVDQG